MKKHLRKRDHHRKRKNRPSATMLGGYEAATWSPARPIPFWPTLDPRQEVDAFDCWALWTGARALYANSSDVRMVVKTVVDLVGYLTPMPATTDTEWNRLALEAFQRRAQKASLFDASGRLDWQDAARWLVRRAIIDGDALVVLGKAPDRGAQFHFYPANQVWGDDEFQLGCQLDRAGRILRYRIANGDTSRTVEGWQAILYQNEPDSGRFRGVTGLVSAINDAVDLKDFDNLTKASAKLAASYAIIETKPESDPRAEMQGAIRERVLRNLAGGGADAESAPDPAPAPAPVPAYEHRAEPFSVNGVTVSSLAPGRDLKILHDSRPSNEVQSYMHDVKGRLAYALGFDPCLVYYVSELGSAGVRYALQRNRRTLQTWRHQLKKASDRIYKHIIACEIAAGRLRPCRDEHWTRCDWVPLNDLTIDVGRDTAALLNKYREGLISPDRLTIPTDGVPASAALEAKAEFLAFAQKLSDEKGIPLALLLPGALGSTVAPPTEAAEV